MKLDTRVYPDIDALSRAALEELLRDLREAIATAGPGRACALRGAYAGKDVRAVGYHGEISQ